MLPRSSSLSNISHSQRPRCFLFTFNHGELFNTWDMIQKPLGDHRILEGLVISFACGPVCHRCICWSLHWFKLLYACYMLVMWQHVVFIFAAGHWTKQINKRLDYRRIRVIARTKVCTKKLSTEMWHIMNNRIRINRKTKSVETSYRLKTGKHDLSLVIYKHSLCLRLRFYTKNGFQLLFK